MKFPTHKQHCIVLLLGMVSLSGCSDNPLAPEPAVDQGSPRMVFDLGHPPAQKDMTEPSSDLSFDMDVATDMALTAGDMLSPDQGPHNRACAHTDSRGYWIISSYFAADEDGQLTINKPMGPIDEEGVMRFEGRVIERLEYTEFSVTRVFRLEALDPEIYSPRAEIVLSGEAERVLPDFEVGDTLRFENHARVTGCDFPGEVDELVTLVFNTITDLDDNTLVYAEGTGLLLPGGQIDIPSIAPIPADRWIWRHKQGCTEPSLKPPDANVVLETDGGEIVDLGHTRFEPQDVDLFTFHVAGHENPVPGSCGAWRFYTTPLLP